MTARILPYVVPFLGALALTLVLTPIVRGINRRLGMVDRPGGRRINRTPVPRGGGVALFLGIAVSYSLFLLLSGHQPLGPVPTYVFLRLSALAALSMAIGLADDKWSLPPLAKLAGQVVVGLLVWLWAGLGFSDLWPSIPAPVDCVLTVFWVVGAMNAFNLIDGLDGLASGLALIAVVGMAGGLFFVRCTAQVTFYAAVAGGDWQGVLAQIMMHDAFTDLRKELDLGKNSQVLLFSTEGNTDPDYYRRVVWDGAYGIRENE